MTPLQQIEFDKAKKDVRSLQSGLSVAFIVMFFLVLKVFLL